MIFGKSLSVTSVIHYVGIVFLTMYNLQVIFVFIIVFGKLKDNLININLQQT